MKDRVGTRAEVSTSLVLLNSLGRNLDSHVVSGLKCCGRVPDRCLGCLRGSVLGVLPPALQEGGRPAEGRGACCGREGGRDEGGSGLCDTGDGVDGLPTRTSGRTRVLTFLGRVPSRRGRGCPTDRLPPLRPPPRQTRPTKDSSGPTGRRDTVVIPLSRAPVRGTPDRRLLGVGVHSVPSARVRPTGPSPGRVGRWRTTRTDPLGQRTGISPLSACGETWTPRGVTPVCTEFLGLVPCVLTGLGAGEVGPSHPVSVLVLGPTGWTDRTAGSTKEVSTRGTPGSPSRETHVVLPDSGLFPFLKDHRLDVCPSVLQVGRRQFPRSDLPLPLLHRSRPGVCLRLESRRDSPVGQTRTGSVRKGGKDF